MKRLLLLLSTCYVASCMPPPHPAVLQVRHEENQLPSHLRSPALHNPHLREVLPLASLLHQGEKLVHHREADDVGRRQIYNLLTHAGLIPRRLFHQPSLQHYAPNYQHQNFFDPPALTSPEILQHL
ncbi:uncharacterized protein LOC128674710 [Plodia interpunctella]|uniref:uncharacterized protein LOC128674710 n=1 Tax=Plodia interpunctella TaxID=58824 RepID=UPI002368EB81|nr:uncharacterized protein LOC128674710 [Plodia interpunctella]XP_053609515.1 uncharacterized protein LOC128674710 [Plodia interpunctella]